MNADELRALQAPIKQKYKDDAETALITMHAEGKLDQADVACHVETFTGSARAGLHPAAGGSTDFACSGDMLLQALVACAGVTLNAVATAMGIEIKGGSVKAEGVMDFRGTLGMDKATPVGFQSIDLTFEVESDASEEQLANLIRLAERYCVVYQTLQASPAMTAKLERI
ncbi:MAG: OsmC family protein [Limibacillus sp.]